MQLIDTNVILRFILNDNIEMAEHSAEVTVWGHFNSFPVCRRFSNFTVPFIVQYWKRLLLAWCL